MSSPVPPVQVIEILSRSDLFRRLDPALLDTIARDMVVMEVDEGRALIRQGDQADRMFVIVRGTATASITAKDGRQQTIRQMGPGDIVGEVAIIAGGERTATVTTSSPVVVASFTADQFRRLMAADPAGAHQLSATVVDRLRRSQLAVHLTRLFGALEIDALDEIERSVEWISLRSGEVLFRQNDEADAAYVLISGRLRVSVGDAGGNERIVNEIGRGEAVGEIALLTRGVRSATVYAIRESDLARFSRNAFENLTRKYPGSMVQVAQMMGRRLQNVQFSGQPPHPEIHSVALIPLGNRSDHRVLIDRLVGSISQHRRTRLITAETVDQELGRRGIARVERSDPSSIRLTSWLSEQDLLHDLLILEADREWSAWTERAVRQADLVVLLADAGLDPAPGEIEQRLAASLPDYGELRHVLVLLHAPDTERPSGTARWLDPRNLEAHYHIRTDRQGDFDRVARCLTGNAVGLALGGGGARGFAHLGVYRALVEQGVPIDVVGGTSQGSIIAANIALGWTPAEAIEGCRRHFTSLFDYTLPITSVIAGRRINTELKNGFGDVDIEDLWIPFICVSTNLTRASQMVHRRGTLWRSVRASIALPGVMPPVYDDGDLLVDGGLLNNLPGDVVRTLARGYLIAVDVTPEVDVSAAEPFEPEISGWWALWHRFKPMGRRRLFPSMLTVLLRSSVLSGVQARNKFLNEQLADLYLHPDMSKWPMLDFASVEQIAEHGYESTIRQIRDWPLLEQIASR